jgi:hypothetical protein
LRRNYLLKHITEEMIGWRKRGESRRKQLLDACLKEKGRRWNLDERALNLTLRRTGFGRGYGSVAGQTS